MPCYNGPNPVKDDERMAIWKWAKANGIDEGRPFSEMHERINAHFFAGQAKPEWITDILSGRKTPLRELSNAAWKQQYNRRQIVRQAQEIAGRKALPPVVRALKSIWDVPRRLAVAGHGFVFPVTHGGDLLLRPESWGVAFKGIFNTWTKSWPGKQADIERMIYARERQPLYDLALRSKLDVGATSHGTTDLLNPTKKGSMSERSWEALKEMRWQLWNEKMESKLKPGMTEAERLDLGAHMADWANHATGSVKSGLNLPGIGNVIFGPKLTMSKLSRLFADPVKTVNTFANWKNATVGEKAVAWTRLWGATQYVTTALGFLAANQGYLWATGAKDKNGKPVNINFNNPKQSDFLSFKAGGLEFSIPGIHSEIRTLAQILAIRFMDAKEMAKASRGAGPEAYFNQKMGDYLAGKVNPAVAAAKDIFYGHDWQGRPLPWDPDKGTATKPKYRWDEYLLSHGPIPLTGPIKYFYDHLRKQGASGADAMGVTKALITMGMSDVKPWVITALGITGLHAGEDYGPTVKAAAKRAHIANQLQAGH